MTEIQEQLEQEYQRFVEFGHLLDRKMRRYLVHYLQNKLEPGRHIIPELNDQYYAYFQQALDELFSIPGLLDLAEGNAKITKQVVLDILRWLRKSYDKARAKNPYEDELQRLEGWAITPMHVFVRRWPNLPTFLRTQYSREEIDSNFYQDRFQQLIGNKAFDELNADEKAGAERLLKDVLAQWDARLHAKILDFQLKKLDEEKEAFTALVEKKVDEYQKLYELVSPFSDYLGWDMSRELWEETSFDILEQYNELLEDERSLKELAEMLGRMREAEIEIEEETFEKTIIRQEWEVDETAKAEIVGVHESDDLNNLLSAEASLLGDEDTELLFLKKYADKNLMTFRYEDRKLVRSEDQLTEINQRVRQKEKGPFIVCVDTSESMTGRPEQIAKVLCMGILKMAINENRRAYLINFSRGIKTLDLYNIADSIDEIAAFLRMSFYGGTDVSLALYETIRQLKGNDYEDADVLIISDFIMYKIDDDVLREVRFFQQNKGTQFHSLTLSKEANPEVLEFFDTNWVYNPKQKGIIRELTAGLQDIRH
ncbi:VWA domain-containing protein [Phaeodactylibacter sp.]|uniref:VWA domain-containing protein n=1 Tax=Phaeodactylibacter sp. TaxID=1940289 RepID=UPI0025FF643B|nr:VWA domain-containing protein [Phaeodactylibacter sp.]MCI4648979.1 VWA domain-containing protein [Phaeodactylibacter sp.]MCI5092900.1 VWA domain-containing protein [Phaeodactylibacter sp.]